MDKKSILDIIVKHTREVVPGLDGQEIQEDDSLASLGANSIDRADIIMMTLEELELEISLVEMAPARCIGDLVDIMLRRMPGA